MLFALRNEHKTLGTRSGTLWFKVMVLRDGFVMVNFDWQLNYIKTSLKGLEKWLGGQKHLHQLGSPELSITPLTGDPKGPLWASYLHVPRRVCVCAKHPYIFIHIEEGRKE